MANYKNSKITKENVAAAIKFIEENEALKKGVLTQKFCEQFNCSKATALKVINRDPEIMALLEEAAPQNEPPKKAAKTTKTKPTKTKEKTPKPAKLTAAEQLEQDELMAEMAMLAEDPELEEETVRYGLFDDDEDEIDYRTEEERQFEFGNLPDTDKLATELTIATKIGKEVRDVIVSAELTRGDIRFMVNEFYQMQDKRIAVDNQIRALVKEHERKLKELAQTLMSKYDIEEEEATEMARAQLAEDVENPETACTILRWEAGHIHTIEGGIKTIISDVVSRDPLCQWMMQIRGIGPAYAAGLRAMLDIRKANYATGFHSFAGLNDRKTPWIGKAKFAKICTDIWADLGDNKKELTTEFLTELAVRTGRTYTKVLTAATTKWDGKKKKVIHLDNPSFAALANNMVKVPYNKRLKVHMFKIADRWNKMINDKSSLYAQIIANRKVMEIERNERGDFAEYAAKLLREVKYTNEDTIRTMKGGKLTRGHLQYRAYRIAEKVFLCHVFEAMYIYEHGKYPARFYTLDVLGHQDEILPEVPYDMLFDAYEQRTGLKANRFRKPLAADTRADSLRNRVERNVDREYTVDEQLAMMAKYADDEVRIFDM